jgi:hypothetical protein
MTLTDHNIHIEWKRVGIWPLNNQKLLNNPVIKNFGYTTLEYQPSIVNKGPNHLLTISKKEDKL